MKKTMALLSIILACGFASKAEAIIVSGQLTSGSAFNNGGTFQELVGFSGPVGNNNFQTNNLYGFNESQNVTLASALASNVGLGSISAGSMVSSHYIFFDPGPSRRAIGHVIFDAPILGVITSRDNLLASDFLGNAGVSYLNPNLRGLESADSLAINGANLFRLDVNFRASSPGDYVRVITDATPTAAAPEPATMALFATGLAGAFIRKRQQA